MSIITDFQSRILDQEPDTIAFIPQLPDYIIIGTYHLNKKDEHEGQDLDKTTSPLRGGSLQILPYRTDPQHHETLIPLARKDFSCAIVDIHFHPEDETLLGAATSTGQLRFFRIIQDETPTSHHPAFHILEIGATTISETGDGENVPLVTFFSWLPGTIRIEDVPTAAFQVVTAVACDTQGDVQLVRVTLPTLDNKNTTQLQDGSSLTQVKSEMEHVHKHQHGLEAWYVTSMPLPQPETDADYSTHLILSGGDDVCLLASTCNISPSHTGDLLSSPPIKQFNMRKQHESGVVSITALPAMRPGITPVLTGSYDDHLRIFMFNPSELPRPPVLSGSIDLGGGVWRVSVLDRYTTPADHVDHYVLLVCTMYDGAKIVRLTSRSGIKSLDDGCDDIAETKWEFKVEAVFKQGHASMVYAALGRPAKRNGTWDILTTSFYDRKLCEWDWEDSVRSSLVES